MKSISTFDEKLLEKGVDRLILLKNPSEILFLTRLSAELGHRIYVKRDDLSSIGMGGNKLRKLEYLLAEARRKGANRIITVGARQSNHARLTAYAAKMSGFDVDLVLKNSVANSSELYRNNGNIILDELVDARIHEIPNDHRVSEFIEKLVHDYREKGEKPYFIPVGGSNTTGGLGYARAVLEIEEQARSMDLDFSHIGVASGSGGTHGGLLAGVVYIEKDIQIQGYNVQLDREPILEDTRTIIKEIAGLLNDQEHIDESKIHLSNDYVGEGYGLLNDETKACIKKVAQVEGMLLDPVYSGKAFTGFINDIKLGRFTNSRDFLFIHTGGTPSIFAYADRF
ncbi:D-cysteine desulfhydrase family protein [Sphingobacterium lactis]|uniref:D-cysteine desulfhydrase family protein n=1 Tax=Sphingobacterium lactis TaxID=797291 RepID=UPI003F7E7B13